MTRSTAREIAIHYIFELGFSTLSAEALLEEELNRVRFTQMAVESELYAEYPSQAQEEYIRNLVKGTFVHSPELDGYIGDYAVGWTFSRIPRMAAAIMRTAMYEVLYVPDVPNAAAINEALEIAKGYEDPDMISFMNGILGSFVRNEFKDTAPKPVKAVEPKIEAIPETDVILPAVTVETAEQTEE